MEEKSKMKKIGRWERNKDGEEKGRCNVTAFDFFF
jgi:hypothetical protein